MQTTGTAPQLYDPGMKSKKKKVKGMESPKPRQMPFPMAPKKRKKK